MITVVDEAHELFCSALDDAKSVEADGWYWTVAELPAADGGTHLVVEGQTPERSHLPAQAFATRMLHVWRPRCLVLADCGGGIWGEGKRPRDDVALGDVVVSELLHYYELQKLVAGGTRVPRYIRWQSISPRLSTTARQLDELRPNWRARCQVERPGAAQLKLGELVCGDKLLADPAASEVSRIVTEYDKALAVDMETVGVAHAALEAADDGLPLSFVALRGISDWMDGKDNQATRDDWKLAACDAAVAATLALIDATPSVGNVATAEELESLDELRRRLDTSYAVPSDAYASVVRTGTGQLTRNDALAMVMQRHGAVLVGGAGVGKSSILHQAVKASSSPLEPFPVLIDLKLWKPAYSNRLAEDPSGAELLPSLDALLRASVQRIGVKLLDAIAVRRPVLLFVDGLNEVSFADVGRRILTLLDEYMRTRPHVRTLVTDRSLGEFYDESGWTTMRLEPLEVAEVKRVLTEQLGEDAAADLGAAVELLRIPFFLNRAIRGGNLALISRAAALQDFFAVQLDLSDDQLDALAHAAFEVYLQRRRSFPATAIADVAGDDVFAMLQDAGVVLGEEDLAFHHQLEHDYLAARHLAACARQWTPVVFDAMTFDAASFDVLGLTLEQLTREDERDAFLRAVYDWNWGGTIAAMIAAEHDGSPAASAPLRMALLAVIAEKRFDRVDGTRGVTIQHLERFSGDVAAQLTSAPSLAALIDVVRVAPSGPEWFEQWRACFCRMPPTPLSEQEAALIASSDSLIGWTMASVARRFAHDPERAAQLRALYAAHPSADSTARAIRWRVVHVLGAWPTEANTAALLQAIGDDYSWVQYGAVRSLMETAARTGDLRLREHIVQNLLTRIRELGDEPLSQFAWSSLYEGAPDDYAPAVHPLLQAALALQQNETGRRIWLRRIARFEAFWATQLT